MPWQFHAQPVWKRGLCCFAFELAWHSRVSNPTNGQLVDCSSPAYTESTDPNCQIPPTAEAVKK